MNIISEQTHPADLPPAPASPKSATAIVVVHGIGQQLHYSCAAALARNMASRLHGSVKIVPSTSPALSSSSKSYRQSECLPEGSPIDTDLCLRITPIIPGGSAMSQLDHPEQTFDIHECWWGPLAQPNLSPINVLWWMVTALLPTRTNQYITARQFTVKGALDLMQFAVTATLAISSIVACILVTWNRAWPVHVPNHNTSRQTLATIISCALFILILGTCFCRFISRYLGDVEAFLSRNPYSPQHGMRRRIIEAFSSRFKSVVARYELGDYDNIVIVAHSLGAIVALDGLASFMESTMGRSFDGKQMLSEKISLLMLGAPLAKIPYMDHFIDPLRSWRTISGRDDVPHGLRAAFHFYYGNDPVADIPAFPRLVHHRLKSGIPLLCHLEYWSDPAVADWIIRSSAWKRPAKIAFDTSRVLALSNRPCPLS